MAKSINLSELYPEDIEAATEEALACESSDAPELALRSGDPAKLYAVIEEEELANAEVEVCVVQDAPAAAVSPAE